jgi:hypothetical protein
MSFYCLSRWTVTYVPGPKCYLCARSVQPVPNLPPYDPSTPQPFPWEPAVHAAIAKLRAERAEKKAQTRAKTAGAE